jgi:hypothetical protein
LVARILVVVGVAVEVVFNRHIALLLVGVGLIVVAAAIMVVGRRRAKST